MGAAGELAELGDVGEVLSSSLGSEEPFCTRCGGLGRFWKAIFSFRSLSGDSLDCSSGCPSDCVSNCPSGSTSGIASVLASEPASERGTGGAVQHQNVQQSGGNKNMGQTIAPSEIRRLLLLFILRLFLGVGLLLLR